MDNSSNRRRQSYPYYRLTDTPVTDPTWYETNLQTEDATETLLLIDVIRTSHCIHTQASETEFFTFELFVAAKIILECLK